MALESHRYKGIARNGKIELEKGAKVPDGAEVIVLFEESSAKYGASTWPAGFFERYWGALESRPIEPPEELPYEKREPLF